MYTVKWFLEWNPSVPYPCFTRALPVRYVSVGVPYPCVMCPCRTRALSVPACLTRALPVPYPCVMCPLSVRYLCGICPSTNRQIANVLFVKCKKTYTWFWVLEQFKKVEVRNWSAVARIEDCHQFGKLRFCHSKTETIYNIFKIFSWNLSAPVL